jgi:hypothetical protein
VVQIDVAALRTDGAALESAKRALAAQVEPVVDRNDLATEASNVAPEKLRPMYWCLKEGT